MHLLRIADANGALAEGLDFTAFGERRGYGDPNASGSASPTTTRGFTGHEMVDGTGVIHMNGRIYDAALGRFLQPDPLVQEPDNAQSWNAYTYVFNNPLAYTDPTGMFTFRQLVGIAIAVIGTLVAPQAGGFWAKLGYAVAIGFASGYAATGTFKGGVIGAFSAGITMGIANAGGLDTWQKVGLQATTGGVMESLSGGKFGHGFVSAGVTASVMPQVGHIRNDAVRTTVGALVGGTLSKATGGKFANGAVSGAIQGAMARREDTQVEYLESDSVSPYPAEGETAESRRLIFERMKSSRELYGIDIPSGYKIEFDDRYKTLVNGVPQYCSENCDDLLAQGTVFGQIDRRPAVRTITVFRAGVQPTYMSGISVVNGVTTFWAKDFTTNGYETMVHTLGHEGAHANGIDIDIPGDAIHPSAQRAGDEALRRYRSLFNGVGSRAR